MTLRASWLEMTGTALTGLRRATRPRLARLGGWRAPPCGGREHEAIVWLGEGAVPIRGTGDERRLASRYPSLRDDPAWPAHCARCHYRFHDGDVWQDVTEPLYTDGGKTYLLSAEHNPPYAPPAPDGSMWDAWWLPREWGGPGRGERITLVVRCPGGTLFVPGRPVKVTVTVASPRWAPTLESMDYLWQWEGDPRRGRVTVHPQIEVGQPGEAGHWYGRLIDGEFRPG